MTVDDEVQPDAPVPTHSPAYDRPPKQPLNPAYAILVGAVLTAVAGLGATFLNIRSSERLSKERDKAAALAEEQAALQEEWSAKVDGLQQQLEAANRRIETLSATTLAGAPVTAAPLPSIVVVLPPAATTVAAPVTTAPVSPVSPVRPTPTSTLPAVTTTAAPSTTAAPPASTTTVTSTVPGTARP